MKKNILFNQLVENQDIVIVIENYVLPVKRKKASKGSLNAYIYVKTCWLK